MNIGQFLGLNSWEIKKSYEYNDSGETLILNAKMSLINEKSSSDTYSPNFQYNIYLEISSTENIHQTNVCHVFFEILRNGVRIDLFNISNYNENTTILKQVSLGKNDLLTCRGFTNITYVLNNISKTKIFQIELNFFQSPNPKEIYTIPEPLIKILFFLLYIIIPIVLYFVIQPDISNPSEAEQERNEKFWKFIEERNKGNESSKEKNKNQ